MKPAWFVLVWVNIVQLLAASILLVAVLGPLKGILAIAAGLVLGLVTVRLIWRWMK